MEVLHPLIYFLLFFLKSLQFSNCFLPCCKQVLINGFSQPAVRSVPIPVSLCEVNPVPHEHTTSRYIDLKKDSPAGSPIFNFVPKSSDPGSSQGGTKLKLFGLRKTFLEAECMQFVLPVRASYLESVLDCPFLRKHLQNGEQNNVSQLMTKILLVFSRNYLFKVEPERQ